MIANVTKGRKAVGALLYDFGPGKRDEHINPRFVAGNVVGTPMQVARMLDHTARLRPEISRPIWRTSLSLPDEDGVLTDAKWAVIATRFVEEMGFADTPWVAVRHGDDHIHLTVSRVTWTGQLLSDQHDYARARAAADLLEQEHDLVPARSRFRADGPMVRNRELQAAQRRGVEVPEREQLRTLIRQVRDASTGLGRDAFETGLADAGINFRANEASTGRMNGYSFTLPGWTDGAGAQVWVTASKVAKDLRWAELHRVLGDGPAPTATPVVPMSRVEAANLRSPSRTLPAQAAAEPDVEDRAAARAERMADLAERLRQGRIERGTALSSDDPVLSTDPAKRIYEQYKRKAEGKEVPADPTAKRPAGKPTAAWDDKRRRPFGTYAHSKLPLEVEATEKKVATYRRRAAAAEEQVRAWDARATGQVTGRQEVQLHEHLAKLEAAEPLITQARDHWAVVKAAEKALEAERATFREANGRKDMGRWALRRIGTNRKVEAERARTAGDRITELAAQRETAAIEATKAAQAAEKKAGIRDPGDTLDRLRAAWELKLANARDDDQATAVGQRETARGQVAEYDKYARGAERRLDQLRAEVQLREEMPKGQREAEGRARRQAAQEVREKKAKAPKKQTYGRRSPYGRGPAAEEQPYHLRQPPPGRGGPGMGL
ncbi:relaxase/mobilization nuclease domain-containing protein [Streptomyces sp. NPDC059122]|uniref:relaxase/mobilization nuclease domain-containing protein n=1 Tax=Streptomyces sp. NPDC059122 TaxID=3346732 RepID=UPI00369E13DD